MTTTTAPGIPDGYRIGLTHPAPGNPGGHCRVTLVTRNKTADEPLEPTEERRFHIRYRSYCGGCGHVGPARSEENTAVEDGLDHAYPEWRDMPVVGERPWRPGSAAALERWEREALQLYPEGWFERGGPVLTLRRPPGERHVPGRTPGGGGYDVAMSQLAERARTRGDGQESLF